MVSFKLAAIKILKEVNKPLHVDEITKLALEQNLIETSGSTPEATMHAQIVVDIKNKGKSSAFVRGSPATFSLNPSYTLKEEKEEIAEEKIKQEEEKENISTQYIGKAGEHLVASELLFKGFNASIMSVDERMDIVATKENRLYNIQVKTANENKFNSYVADIKISSFDKHNQYNSFYIFVLKGEKTNFLILPFAEIEKNVTQKNILLVANNTRYRINIRIREGKLYLGNKENEMSYFMNNWGLIK
jgi:Holliday junction resolvase